MNSALSPANLPFTLSFNGCPADEEFADLCSEEILALDPRSNRLQSCAIVLTQKSQTTRIRITVRTGTGVFSVDRVSRGVDPRQLRASLHAAFAQLSWNLRKTSRDPPAATGIPPCTWYG